MKQVMEYMAGKALCFTHERNYPMKPKGEQLPYRFWTKHGLSATMDAYLVSQRTLFYWQRLFKEAQSKVAQIAPKSPALVRKQQRFVWDKRVIAKAHAIRSECPSLGLEK